MSHWRARLLLPALLIAVGAVFPVRAQTPPGALPFVRYGAEVGFGQWNVRDIAQDSRGVLWVGTDDGIYLYDGHRLRRAEHQGLPSAYISRLVAGAHGDMWCATLEGGARWHAGQWSPYGAAQGLPGAWEDVRVDETGRAWVATQQGLFWEEEGRFARVPGWPGGVPLALWSEPGGGLYAVTAGALHHREPDGRWRTWGEAQGVPREGLRQVARDGAGRVWIWGNYSMWRLPAGARAFEPVPGLEANRSLWRAVRDRHGRLWLGSDKGLVEVGEDGRPHGVTGPPTQRVAVAFEDREGSLWVGGLGLFRLAGGGLWRTHSVAQGLPSAEVWAIHREEGGRLWAGTSQGLARATAEGWVPVAELPPRAVRGIYQEPGGGALWLSGGWAELFRYEPRTGGLERFGPEHGLSAAVTLEVVRDGEGRLWVATTAGVLRGERRGTGWRFVPVVLPGGPPNEVVLDVEVDRRGRVWLAGHAGLVVVEGNGPRRFTVADGLRRDSASYLLERRSGEMCVSYFRVAGMSCFRYDGGTPGGFTHLDTTRGLASDRIYQLGEDAAGRLWVGTGKGVDVLGPEGGVHFSVADGLPGDDCSARAFWLDPHGEVWVGTSTGLGQFLAPRYTGPPRPPEAVVASVRAGGWALEPGPHEVPYPRNTLEVEVRAHTFLNEGQVQHQVRLVGLEPEWRVLEGLQARYTALAPGTYEFQARARHAPGAWGPIASFSFVVLRPWWRTGWFYAGCLLGLGGLFSLAIHTRERTARSQRARLEALVTQRTRELEQAQARLVQMERDATEQQMAGGFAHEMRNALTGAKMLLGTVRSGGGEPGPSLCVRNGALLKELYVGVREHLPPEVRPRVATLLKELNGNEARMEQVMQDTDEALGRALSVTQLILEYARLGRERPSPEPTRVLEVLTPLLEESREDFAAHSITLRLEGSTDCTVAAKPIHLYSLLKNLVLNARDALVEKSGPGAREIRITLEEEPEWGVLRVEDTGAGMPSEVRERIFEPFFTTKPDEGTGLGLSVVRKLVTLYAGTLSVESEPGRGTCFTLRLPRPAPAPRARPASP
ncbi:MAG TPA: ATP-binding protein [Archangium sp.]|uniref:sensor histidine kinase n=1 Tax=Archangium sp. TaxID=1872627 RepID=UPI002E38067B|nr:ATP-binding protein [Archangium sp.]HEX5750153.1 ATP-binding protein [Archangium sp.]